LNHAVDGLTRSKIYGFRYRAKNALGWSLYSPIAYIPLAIEPGKAERPVFISSNQTNLILQLNLNVENRGAEITKYEL